MAVDRPTILREAEKLVRQGKLSRAIEEYLRALEEQPRDWTTANTVGDLYVRMGQDDQAVSYFIRVADGLLQDGFLPRSAAFYKKVLKLQPKHEHALLSAARIAAEQGLTVDARAYLMTAADERRARGDQRGLAEISIRLAALTPGDLDARRAAADARLELGDHGGAVRELVLLAADCSAGGDREHALGAWDRASSIAPERLGRALEELATRADAGYSLVEHLVERDTARSDWTAAADRIDAFTRLRAGHVSAHQRLVDVIVDGGLSTRLTDAQARLAEAYLTAGMAAEARFVAEDLMSAEPSEPAHESLFRKAVGLLGEDPDAAVAHRRALALDVDEPSGPAIARASETAPAPPPEVASASVGTAFPQTTIAPPPAPVVVASPQAGDPVPGPRATAGRDTLEIDVDAILRAAPGLPAAAGLPDFEVDLGMELNAMAKVGAAPAVSRNLDDVFAGFRREAGEKLSGESADSQLASGERLLKDGRVDDGLRALEQAARTPRLRFDAASRIARTLKGRGHLQRAIEWFERAADAPAPSHDAGRALLYELADTLETLGEEARALAIFLELETEAGAYKDVRSRIGRLTQTQERG